MNTGNTNSITSKTSVQKEQSQEKIHSNEFIVRHLGLVASSLELDYTPYTDIDAQYGYFHGVMWPRSTQ